MSHKSIAKPKVSNSKKSNILSLKKSDTRSSLQLDNATGDIANPENVLQLQSVIGNQAVQRLLDQQATPLPIQRQSGHNKGCGCATCAGAIQRADEHEEDIQAKRFIQREGGHEEGCGCATCAGAIQRADEHEEDIQAKRIQRADEHEEDIQAKRIQREDEEAEKPSIKDRLEQLKKKNLKKKLTAVSAEYEAITLDDIKSHVESASQFQRNRVWKSDTLMTSLKAKMSKGDYLKLLPQLRVFEKGKTAEDKKSHTRADKADKFIRKYLGDKVEGAVKRGAAVEGQVSVVDGDDWTMAYENQFGDDGMEAITNAFVDRNRLIWIHKNRGNAGTIIHEGIHKYSTGDFLREVGFNFNEGITEYFTRLVCDKLKYKRGNYESNYKFAKKFVEFMGEDLVTKAYFDGEVDTLKEKFEDKEKDWSVLKQHVKDKNWSDAKAMFTD